MKKSPFVTNLLSRGQRCKPAFLIPFAEHLTQLRGRAFALAHNCFLLQVNFCTEELSDGQMSDGGDHGSGGGSAAVVTATLDSAREADPGVTTMYGLSVERVQPKTKVGKECWLTEHHATT